MRFITSPPAATWARPPSCLRACDLSVPPNERENGVVHVLADVIEDISPMLDSLLEPQNGHRPAQGAQQG